MARIGLSAVALACVRSVSAIASNDAGISLAPSTSSGRGVFFVPLRFPLILSLSKDAPCSCGGRPVNRRPAPASTLLHAPEREIVFLIVVAGDEGVLVAPFGMNIVLGDQERRL